MSKSTPHRLLKKVKKSSNNDEAETTPKQTKSSTRRKTLLRRSSKKSESDSATSTSTSGRSLLRRSKKKESSSSEQNTAKTVARENVANDTTAESKAASLEQNTVSGVETAETDVVSNTSTTISAQNETKKDIENITVTTDTETSKTIIETVSTSTTNVKTTDTAETIDATDSVETPQTKAAAPKTATAKKKEEFDPLAGLGKAVIAPPPNYRPGVKTVAAKIKEQANSESKKDKDWKSGDDKSDRTKSTRFKSKSRRSKQKNWGDETIDTPKEDSRQNRRRRKKNRIKPKASPKAKAIKRRVMIDGTITVANLAHEMSEKSTNVIKKLLSMGQMASINDELDIDTATLIAEEFDYEVVDTSFQEEEFLITTEEAQTENLDSRPPIVTIMGHVDHGKTTLLDTIRKANVAAGEAGGITQHTSAYQVEHDGHLITFIDTPGHEAFTSMRARGAQVTDIVILVIAADDGPMPQTIEALNHAKASGVQIMVAINKCDKPGANPDKVRQEMMRYELVDESYGGDTIFVEVSALKGLGIEELLENVILLSEMGEFKATQDRHADGFVLEARLEKGRGAVATLLVKNGTLKQGDTLVLGNVWGRVRAMHDYKGKKIKKALPSTPVELIGLQDIPVAGDDFVVVKNNKDAKALVEHRQELAKQKKASSRKVSLEDLLRYQQEGEPVKLNLIVKSDVGGTLEALRASIAKIDVPGTEVNIMHEAIGAITEGDVSLAHTYEGIIIGFNVRPDAKARSLINQNDVEVRTYNIIYEALEDIENGLKGLLAPELKEKWLGLAEIRETFSIPKVGTVAGCFVIDGKIARSHQVRLLREGTIVWEGKLASLKRFKDDVREVEKGYECGMNLDGFNDIKIGDQLETYMMEEQKII